MKNPALFCAALLALSLPARSQLVLNPGDTWTYRFNSLVRTGLVSSFLESPNGSLAVTVDSSTFQAGETLRYEMFETDTSETPICSGLFIAVPPSTATCQVDSSWQDL